MTLQWLRLCIATAGGMDSIAGWIISFFILKKIIDIAIYYKGNWPRFLSSFLLLVWEGGPTENVLGERK